jgi:hypothetical protein
MANSSPNTNDNRGTAKKLKDSTAIPPGVGKPNGENNPEPFADNVTPFDPGTSARPAIGPAERETLDREEALANDALLDDDEGDAPGDRDEIVKPLVDKKLPKFSIFQASLVTFELWGTVEQSGMDELLWLTTKSFAPNFEDDVELRRYRFYETVTTDGIVRLIWCPVPGKDERRPNAWIITKLDAMTLAQGTWTTMRSRSKLGQWTYRAAKRQDYPGPKFSGRTPTQWVTELRKLKMIVDTPDHHFYKRATDNE